ncbi:MAG: acyl-CoA thioesterase [Bacteroidales bacterium]|nr:acyl-CoA thioesterase [Bacteroidales bacterium]
MSQKILQVEKEVDIRFSEVDSMGFVWHGNYAMYFEDARELFGQTYQLEYLRMYEMGFYAPLVELKFNYKKAVRYQSRIKVKCTYRNTDSAKIVFDYEIRDAATDELMVTGHTVQVFLDLNYNLIWQVPDFYKEWKSINGIL